MALSKVEINVHCHCTHFKFPVILKFSQKNWWEKKKKKRIHISTFLEDRNMPNSFLA